MLFYELHHLHCPHNEIKLEQNSFKTVSKLFWKCFVAVSFRCADSYSKLIAYTVSRKIFARDSAIVPRRQVRSVVGPRLSTSSSLNVITHHPSSIIVGVRAFPVAATPVFTTNNDAT